MQGVVNGELVWIGGAPKPLYTNGVRAVYYFEPYYEVHFVGTYDTYPFRTVDKELAYLVCDEWERAEL